MLSLCSRSAFSSASINFHKLGCQHCRALYTLATTVAESSPSCNCPSVWCMTVFTRPVDEISIYCVNAYVTLTPFFTCPAFLVTIFVRCYITIDNIVLINKNFTITPLSNAIMSAVAAAQRPFTKCRGHISPLLIGYHKLSLVVCSLFNVSCQLSLAFARQTMCPVTVQLNAYDFG